MKWDDIFAVIVGFWTYSGFSDMAAWVRLSADTHRRVHAGPEDLRSGKKNDLLKIQALPRKDPVLSTNAWTLSGLQELKPWRRDSEDDS